MHVRIKRVRMSRWHKIRRSFRHLEIPLLPPLLLPFWIRLACVLGLLCILFGVLMMLRIWRTTPPDFERAVKIRGINYIQAWSLKRTARKEMAAGRYDAAALAWRMAAAHNLGDLEASRGYLEALLQDFDLSGEAAAQFVPNGTPRQLRLELLDAVFQPGAFATCAETAFFRLFNASAC